MTIDKSWGPVQAEAVRPSADVPAYPPAEPMSAEQRLLHLKNNCELWAFFWAAVELKKNIVIASSADSGKTAFGKTFMNFFIPLRERVVTIEPAREIFLPGHLNRVHLLHSKLGSNTTEVTAKTLLQFCTRMKPDRVLLAEMHSGVAYDYIANISEKYPGSITTVPAHNCTDALDMLTLCLKESDEGSKLSSEHILGLVRKNIDVVIHVQALERVGADGRVKQVRSITEIYYDPVCAPVM